MHRARNISLVLVFVAILLALTAAHVFRWDPMASVNEKRALAPRPEGPLWSRDFFTNAPVMAQAWEKYFGDHLGLRKLLLGSYRLLAYQLFHISHNPAVVVGESDGQRRWLYFEATAVSDGLGLDAMMGKLPYTHDTLAPAMWQIKAVTDLTRAKGIELVIVVCPDKQTIYPEYLPPDKRPPPGSASRLDQFWHAAAGLGDVPLVDLRPVLRAAKQSMQVYYPTDTHWTWKGAALAYRDIALALKAQDPSRAVLPIDTIRWYLGPSRAGDLTLLMGIPAIGGDEDWLPDVPQLAAQAGPKRGKLLVLGDSFFDILRLFFDMQFAEVKLYHVTVDIRTQLTAALLDAEKPDVVILESVERYWTAK